MTCPPVAESEAAILTAAAGIVARHWPTPDTNPGPCANCGHTNVNMSGGHERGVGRCHGGLDPCPARCQTYARPEPLDAQRLRRRATTLTTT